MEQIAGVTSSLRDMLRHLENSQWWPPDIMRRHQFGLLEPLLAHAYRTAPWYRRRFDEIGLRGNDLANESAWRALPLLTRSDIQGAGELLHSSEVPTSNGRVSRKWTSGSTASPVMVLRTELTGRVWLADALREFRWQGCDLGRSLAVIRNSPGNAEPPTGATVENWGLVTGFGFKAGLCAVLDVRSTIAEQADWLERVQPAYFQSYPSVVYELAKYFCNAGRRLPSLSQVHTYGEALEPQVRKLCKRAWGVEIFDSYSTNEVGYVASQCAKCEGYHVQAEHLLVEVLDDSGRECSPGQTGRVVVTDLFNYAMPLLRYEIGDYAEVGEPCSCGRKLPILRRILGRQRNMFVLPNGQKRWPAMEVNALETFEGRLPVRQFQVIQRGRTELEVKLAVARQLVPREEAGIREMLAQWFSDGFSVRFTYVDHIPRGPTGKFEDFRCELDGDS